MIRGIIGILLFLTSASVWADSNFQVLSPAFEPLTEIPQKYSCKGSNVSPPLEIYNVPPKTKSFALTVYDPDAPEGTWVHWVVANIKPEKVSIPANDIPGLQLLNDFGAFHYGGPCPPDKKLHHYHFKVYALDKVLEIR